ncbi:histidine kinase [Algoriphagus halophytocola]|uniref:Histidine kinase n=1 Tax=Algoriphagus halophytocola TaxID=2991499 RepID=A0ABY6ML64_9BACT|nr:MULTISPECIES: histidine kinase [unclassified Algoriphagus]UZD23122.1 histidine kinase [Algoriphagus sp. TR-M5]WBL44414.1 histidine kinase [Algoriphagus sp. TR-M9]
MKAFYIFLLFYFLIDHAILAQEKPIIHQEPLHPKVLQIDSVIKINEAVDFGRRGMYGSTENLGIAKSGIQYWFEIDLSDQQSKISGHDSIYFYPYGVEKGAVYIDRNGVLLPLVYSTLEQNALQRTNLESPFYIPLAVKDLIDGTKIYVLSEFLRATPNLSNKTFAFSTPEDHLLFSTFLSISSFKSQVLAFFFLGVASVLMVFNLILFFNMKERQYIYYGLFLLFQLIYYSRISPYLAANFGYEHSHFFFWFTTVAQVCINTFYLLFIRHFLEFPKHLPKFDRVVKGIIVLLCTFLVVVSLIIIFNPYSPLQATLMNWQRYFMATFAFVGVGYLWKFYKGKLVYFVIAGTIVFTTGALLTMFLLDLDYMVTGSAIESTIFALGLSYKIKTIITEKREAERETFQTKLGALRAQINPHFIFNSLSSIQYLISSGQKEAALKYLSKFSKFVRQVLENSIDVHVTLEKEIELLKVYLDLESLRFDHAFLYEVIVPKDSNLCYEEVPMMIVQPFVENSIKHGLMTKKSPEKKLTIRFFDQKEFILCEVEDNGIGRKAAAALKGTNYRPSRGMNLTFERLRLGNKWTSSEDYIQIEDLEQGTKVSIKIPKQ